MFGFVNYQKIIIFSPIKIIFKKLKLIKKLYIFKLSKFYMDILNKLNEFKITYKNNLLILKLFLFFFTFLFLFFFLSIFFSLNVTSNFLQSNTR